MDHCVIKGQTNIFLVPPNTVIYFKEAGITNNCKLGKKVNPRKAFFKTVPSRGVSQYFLTLLCQL